MDFFTRQEQARRKTKWLVLYFILAVIFTAVAVYIGSALVLLRDQQHVRGWWWDPRMFTICVTATIGIVTIGSLQKMVELRRGGGAVASLLGGRRVEVN